MTITPILFEAHLKCPTKCWLRAAGETPSGNEYAEWVKAHGESYRAAESERLLADVPPTEVARSPAADALKTAKWRLALEVTVCAPYETAASRSADSHVRTSDADAKPTSGLGGPRSDVQVESHIHAIERVPSERRGKAAQFIPIRFIRRNKLTKDDKFLLAFDAFVLGQALGRDIPFGKIIHGDLRGCAGSSRGPQFAERTSPDGQQIGGGLGKPNEAPSSQSAIGNGQSTMELSLLTSTLRSTATEDGSAATVTGGSTAGMDEPQTENSATCSQPQPRVTKVKISALFGEVRKHLDKIVALLSPPAIAEGADSRSADSLVRTSDADATPPGGLSGPRSVPVPPDLVLNRHCPECEFRDRCRQKAIETDDLSLLAGMSAKERQKLRSKGIFTVTQLSYTFRPRRRPKRLRDKCEKYHHALEALAIREKKIHIVGSPELKIESTPVYLDVECLLDRAHHKIANAFSPYHQNAVFRPLLLCIQH